MNDVMINVVIVLVYIYCKMFIYEEFNHDREMDLLPLFNLICPTMSICNYNFDYN